MARHRLPHLASLFVVCISMVVSLFGATPPANARPLPVQPTPIVSRAPGKLSDRLAMLAQSPGLFTATPQALARALGLPVRGSGSLLRDRQGRMLVYIRTDNLSDENLRAMTNAGAAITHVSRPYKTITALVSAAGLNTLTAISAIQNIREEYTPVILSRAAAAQKVRPQAPRLPQSCNSVISAGDAHLRADLARSNYGVDGSGVKVGVLSDSYDQNTSAATHAADDIASGDLPGPGNPCGYLTAVNVLSNSLSSDNVDEGRAMMQIVHDLAPGAELGFASAYNGIYAMADNIRNLRAWGADIIVDDIAYLREPMFQDGPVSVAISDVVAAGAVYMTPAGNNNYRIGSTDVASYEAPAFRPMTCPTGIPAYELKCHNFNASGGTASSVSFSLENGAEVNLTLQWAQPWSGITTDLDLFFLNSSNVIAARSEKNNLSEQNPYEYVYLQNTTGSLQTYRLVVGRSNNYGGDAGTPRLKYLLGEGVHGLLSVSTATDHGDVVGPTLSGHAASEYSLSIAAIPYTSTTTPEVSSARGPAVHYFGPVIGPSPAAAIISRTLQQPDFTATDGVCTTFFESIQDGCYRFYKNDASASHAAAIAALMKQRSNQLGGLLRQANTRSILQSTARPMSGGTLNSIGAGLLDANAAVGEVRGLTYHAYLPLVVAGGQPNMPTPGFWSSATYDEFYIDPTSSQVVDFAIYLDLGGTCGYSTVKFTHIISEPIVNSQFYFTGTFYASGTFDSVTAAHGYDGLDHFDLGCAMISGGPWYWNANWQDNTQPALTGATLTARDGSVRQVTARLTHERVRVINASPAK